MTTIRDTFRRSRGAPWRLRLSACALALVTTACADKTDAPRVLAGADPSRAVTIMERAGCGACHAVPGLEWPAGSLGPSLDGFGGSPLIAGRLPNQPAVLTSFLRDAPSLLPDTAMPAMPLTQDEARDVAAYLYTLR